MRERVGMRAAGEKPNRCNDENSSLFKQTNSCRPSPNPTAPSNPACGSVDGS